MKKSILRIHAVDKHLVHSMQLPTQARASHQVTILGASREKISVALTFQVAASESLLGAIQQALAQARCATGGFACLKKKPLRPGVTLVMLGISSKYVTIQLQQVGLLGGTKVGACDLCLLRSAALFVAP